MSDFEIDILTVFYSPAAHMDLCRRINLPENFERRKAAIHRLLDAGYLKDLGGLTLVITHKGHTFLDDRPAGAPGEGHAL
jgi:hypothetical protein